MEGQGDGEPGGDGAGRQCQVLRPGRPTGAAAAEPQGARGGWRPCPSRSPLARSPHAHSTHDARSPWPALALPPAPRCRHARGRSRHLLAPSVDPRGGPHPSTHPSTRLPTAPTPGHGWQPGHCSPGRAKPCQSPRCSGPVPLCAAPRTAAGACHGLGALRARGARGRGRATLAAGGPIPAARSDLRPFPAPGAPRAAGVLATDRARPCGDPAGSAITLK